MPQQIDVGVLGAPGADGTGVPGPRLTSRLRPARHRPVRPRWRRDSQGIEVADAR